MKYIKMKVYITGTDLTTIKPEEFVNAEIIYEDDKDKSPKSFEAHDFIQFFPHLMAFLNGTSLGARLTDGTIEISQAKKNIKSVFVCTKGTDLTNVKKEDFYCASVTYDGDTKSTPIPDYTTYVSVVTEFIGKGGKPSIKLHKDLCKSIEVYTKGTDTADVSKDDFVGAVVYYEGSKKPVYVRAYDDYDAIVNELANLYGKTKDEIKKDDYFSITKIDKNKIYTSIKVYTKGTNLNDIPKKSDFISAMVHYYDAKDPKKEDKTDSYPDSSYEKFCKILHTYVLTKGNSIKKLIENDDISIESGEPVQKKQGILSKAIHSKVVRITALALGAYVVLSAVSGYRTNKDRSNEYSRSTDAPRIEQPVTTPTANITVLPTVSPTSTPYFATEEQDKFTDIVRRMYSGERVDEDDLFYFINEVSRITNTNVAGLRNLLSGKSMSGDRNATIDFYRMFPEGSKEYVVLEFFCQKRDHLINTAFTNNSVSVRSDFNSYMDDINNFVFNNVGIENGNSIIYYYDLTPVGRYMVALLGSQTLLGDNATYTGRIGGRVCSYVQVIDEYSTLYEGLFDLVLNSYGKQK